MAEVSGRHAVVTGGGSGVGAAIALALAGAGAQVTITGRREEPLRAMAARSDAIRWHACDVTDEAAVSKMVSEAGLVDFVVANAGAAESKPFGKMTAGDLRAMLDVNLVGVFNLFRAALPAMRERGAGRLIAIASTAGLKGYPYVAGYCAAKHGVIGLVRALALECASTDITVNAVCPGFTETAMLESSIATIIQKTGRSRAEAEDELKKNNPQKRFIQPDEIAEAVLYLCRPAAASITGQALSISGGEI